MNYPYVIPGQQGQPEIFAANNSGQLGYYDKPVNAIIQLEVDYSLLPSPPSIASYSFQIEPGGEPQLRISAPEVDTTGGHTALRFVIQGGIADRTYTMTINVIGPSSGVRSDVLNINVLGNGSDFCQIISPAPINNGATSPDGSLFVNTAPRFFVSATAPQGARVMDQWWDTTTLQLFSFVTDGASGYWSQMSG